MKSKLYLFGGYFTVAILIISVIFVQRFHLTAHINYLLKFCNTLKKIIFLLF